MNSYTEALKEPGNDPLRWNDLPSEQQAALVKWIQYWFKPSRRKLPSTSYGLKHVFEREPGGFYVNNGTFKGAMLAAGFEPVDAAALNWTFRVEFITHRQRLRGV